MASLDYSWTLQSRAIRFRVSWATDRGGVREVNEDSFVARPPVFLVADGMGGHAFGDRASQATAQLMESRLAGDAPARPTDVLDAVQGANDVVRSIGEGRFAGTTLAGVAFVQGQEGGAPYWMAFNVGDSRIYRWTDDGLLQLSIDHSAVQELLDLGRIAPEDVVGHPERNVVTRAIGLDGDLGPDIWLLPADGTSLFLLCSDGLTKEVDDDDIADILMADDPVPSADRLVARALAAGGDDNVTVVVVETTVVEVEPGGAPSEALPQEYERTRPRGGVPAS